jgi:MFS transporter, ACS family, aldohexuronate transporter
VSPVPSASPACADAGSRMRWVTMAVFVLSSAINYLDRQTLTTLAPVLRAEFHLSHAEYGWILGAFSITYAASAPFAGMFIDRAGLNRAVSLAVGLWSCAGIATGFTRGLGSLVGCRAVLGVAEAAGIPAAGKAIHRYLAPAERALGNALNQAGVSLGSMAALPLAAWLAGTAGWRSAFLVTGALGLLWIPLWNFTARRAGAAAEDDSPQTAGVTAGDVLRDGRLWAFVAANSMAMVGYSLWTNWTTQYLVDVYRVTLTQAARWALIPAAAALFGGLAGGWLSLRLVNRGVPAMTARFRVCLAAAVVSLVNAAIPAAGSPGWSAAGISAAMFGVAAFSVNMYTLPLDAFGLSRAALAVSILVASYGALQFVISPAFGRVIDLYGYAPVTTVAAFTPLAACAVLWMARATR